MRNAVVFSAVVTAVAAISGCAGSVRSEFHPSDPTFRPTPGRAPRVYVEVNIADVPKVGMRSVGLIEVTVPRSGGLERAIEVASGKGGELGCWILIQHTAFATLQTSAALDHGARVILAHGGTPAVKGHGPRRTFTEEFDCVIPTATAPVAVTSSEIRSR